MYRHFCERLRLVLSGSGTIFLMAILFPSLCLAQADRIFKENSQAVVVVVALDEEGNPISQGSGFIVREDGAIVTNYHVISNAADIRIKAGERVLEVEGFLHMDKENDLVILKAKAKGLPVVKLGGMEKSSVGQREVDPILWTVLGLS